MPGPSNNPYKAPGPSFNESRGFQGVELYLPAQDQTGSMLLQADNILNVAGELYVRPGLLGMFGGNPPSSSSSASQSNTSSSSSSVYVDVGNNYYSIPSDALYGLCDFTDSDGNTWILKTFGGRLFKTQQDADFYTELRDTSGNPYDLNSPIVDAAQIGDYVYLVDSNHDMLRVSLNGGFPVYAMQAPSSSPTVALTNVIIDTPTATQWSPGPIPNNQTTLISNGAFDITGPVSGNLYLPGVPWSLTNGPYVLPANSPDYGPGSATNGHSQQHVSGHNFSLLLDNPADSVGQTFNAPYNKSTPWPDPNNLLKSACFLFTAQLLLQSPGSSASLAVTITAYDSAGDQLTTQTQVLTPSNTSTWAQVTAAFNLTLAVNNDPDHYVLSLSSGPKNVSGNGVWVATTSLVAMWDGPFISDVGNGQVRWAVNYGCIGGSYMVRTYTSPKDYSAVGTLGFPISSTSIPLSDLYIRFGFVAFPSSSSSSSSSPSPSSSSSGYPFDGPGVIEWSNDVQYNDAGTFGYVDITTIDPIVLANVQYLIIETVLDLPLGDVVPGTNTNVLTFGPLTAAGELSVGYQYTYYFTEVAQIDSLNIIESNPSAPSALLTTTIEDAEAQITIPNGSPVNTATNQLKLWRLGGVWNDVRLIATVPLDADVPYGTDTNNPNYSWNHSTKTFLDNTPDISLSLADLMSFARDPMPSNAQAVAAWQGRLCVAVGNIIYISWLYSSDNSAPLYTTLTQTAGDPNAAIEGASFPVSSNTADTIVRMIPFGTPITAGNQFGGGLLVLCKKSVWLIQGQDANTFSNQEYPYTNGVGLIAFRGVTRINSNLTVFLGPDRLHFFPPTQDSAEKDPGLRIQPQIYPVPPQTFQDQTAFAKSWLLFHDQKVLLGCPVPGGTQNSVIWVYDLRIGGWTRLTGPQGASSSSLSGPLFPTDGMAVTSALSLPPNQNGAQYELFLFGIDGQLVKLSGTVDQYTPLSPIQPIPFTITVHAMRPSFYIRYKARALYYMWARLESYWVEMVMSGTLTMIAQAYMTGTATPTPIPAARTVQTYGLVGGGRPFRMDCPSGLIEGQYITLTLTGNVTDVAYLRGVRGFISGTSYEQGS